MPFGASVEEWQAAFDELDGSWELTWQTASGAATVAGKHQQAFADQMEEYSGGKVQVEVAFQDAVSGTPQDGDEALSDGRIDMHLLVPFQQPSDFPIAGTLLADSTLAAYQTDSYLGGYLASIPAINEVWYGVPELREEFGGLGLQVIAPMPTAPDMSLACREPVESLADLEGKQIRVGPAGAFAQVEALGATPVSVVFADLFESLQRGIVDCLVVGTQVMGGIPGMTDLAPHLVHLKGSNWVTTPGIDLAGVNWQEWPVAVQQLVYDTMNQYMLLSLRDTQMNSTVQFDAAKAAGGGFSEFDAEVDKAIAKHNKAVIEGWRTSPLIADADAYVDELQASVKKWEALMVDIGIPDAGFADYDEWSTAEIDWDAYDELYWENVHIPNRPGE